MPATSSSARLPLHREYYIHGADAIFSVENTLFRVHRYFFVRESAYFRDKLPYPSPPGETTKGSSDNLPFVLDDVSKTDFERLLWVFYNPKYSLYDANIDEWTSILKLAEQWEFKEVKELAIRGLESLQIAALQKIVLYHEHKVDRNLLQAAYTALTVRDDCITLEEGRALGLETVLQLARAREAARAPRRAGNPRSPINLAGVELDVIINDIFSLSSPSAAQEETTSIPQTPTGGTQTNNGQSSSNTAQRTGSPANGSANGTNGPPNGHVNGGTPNHSPNNTSRTNGRLGGRP